MPLPQVPVATPITFSFDSGEIQLTSVIDPETKQHVVTCDLCSQVIKLGIRGSINCISQHRDGVKCRRSAFKVSKLDSKKRNLVSDADPKVLGSVGENPCGFCGQGSCFAQLKVKKSGGFSIVHIT